jgi:phosphomannomutase
MMLAKKAFIAIESSNGAALNGPNPIKDGILFNLLVLEMLAHFQKPLNQLVHEFQRRFHPPVILETQIKRTPARSQRLGDWQENRSAPDLNSPILRRQNLDGVKWICADGWLLLRESGTEPVLRVVAEAPTQRRARQLLQLGRSLYG